MNFFWLGIIVGYLAFEGMLLVEEKSDQCYIPPAPEGSEYDWEQSCLWRPNEVITFLGALLTAITISVWGAAIHYHKTQKKSFSR